jgi:hypothetical protein
VQTLTFEAALEGNTLAVSLIGEGAIEILVAKVFMLASAATGAINTAGTIIVIIYLAMLSAVDSILEVIMLQLAMWRQ